ncbi:GNAT family N-acetyltransferase [Candidatus Eisenbacteria bacterium]|uniref:GNAT family N-acetyltransferase n=1 Tax=Eiseniibacteriota bacterium TaxID=2212470 RepID=A0ABV6YIM9_UNCEI
MTAADLGLTFETTTEADIPELTDVMKRAFNDDTQKHLGKERGGPPGYDNGDFFRKWLFGYEQSEGHKILADGRIIGGIVVWILDGGENILGTIFVDPGFQDRGIGWRTWEFIEERYPETKSWRLETPAWATKNHHFYQKCGFVRVDNDPLIRASEGSWIYRKQCGAVT